MKRILTMLLFTLILPCQLSAQFSEQDLKDMKSPAKRIAYKKTWGKDHIKDKPPRLLEGENYIYATLPSKSVPSRGVSIDDALQFIILDSVQGYNLTISPTWPSSNGPIKACGHTHLTYGLWIRYPEYGSKWYFYGGGGMSGVTNPKTNKCQLLVDNPLKNFDPIFGWGKEVYNLDFRTAKIDIDIAVGAVIATHGGGGCADFGCYEPVYLINYSF